MEIIFALMALGATPFGAAMLDKPTRNRFVKYLRVHIVDPAKGINNDPELEPMKKRDRNEQAEAKLCVLWQDAFDWFSIPDVAQVYQEARRIREESASKINPLRAQLTQFKLEYDGITHHSHDAWLRMYHAEERFKWAEANEAPVYTQRQRRALEIADKYGWELIDNGLIRNVNKGTPLAVDPIVYAL